VLYDFLLKDLLVELLRVLFSKLVVDFFARLNNI
jgi:hypothetical protein